MKAPKIPPHANSITKGVPLKLSLNEETIHYLSENLHWAWSGFGREQFVIRALEGLEELELMERARHIGRAMKEFLPDDYGEAMEVFVNSMTPARTEVVDIGSAMYYYLPYSAYLAEFGVGDERFETSVRGLYELTMRFTSEWAIRPFLLESEERMMAQIMDWLDDPNPHVRRLCSEGTRPLLPWGTRLANDDPDKTAPILEALKNDEELYVRRSVANHLGDLAKKNPEWVFARCEKWLVEGASTELKWVIRHAVRYWAKREDPRALEIRVKAK